MDLIHLLPWQDSMNEKKKTQKFKNQLPGFSNLYAYICDQTLSKIFVCVRSGPTENVEMRTPTNSDTRRT